MCCCDRLCRIICCLRWRIRAERRKRLILRRRARSTKSLVGRVTPIVPRFSATLVEPKIQRLLQKNHVSEVDVLQEPGALRQRLASQSLPEDLQEAFHAAARSVERNVATIREKLVRVDPTLADAAQTAESKIQYQLERLKGQAAKAELRQAEVIGRHAEMLSQALYPDKGLQERAVGGVYFVARYGLNLLQQLHDTIQIGLPRSSDAGAVREAKTPRIS